MTVVDTSVAVDYLLGFGVAQSLDELMAREHNVAAPDVIVLEVLSALSRLARHGAVPEGRARAALADLSDLSVELFPSLVMRSRAWELRHNFGAGDSQFVALAEQLGEPLATRDRSLARAAREQTGIEVLELHAPA